MDDIRAWIAIAATAATAVAGLVASAAWVRAWRSQAALRGHVDELVEQLYGAARDHLTTRADFRDDFERLERRIQVDAVKLRRRRARRLIQEAVEICREALTADVSFEEQRSLLARMQAAVDKVHKKVGRPGIVPPEGAS